MYVWRLYSQTPRQQSFDGACVFVTGAVFEHLSICHEPSQCIRPGFIGWENIHIIYIKKKTVGPEEIPFSPLPVSFQTAAVCWMQVLWIVFELMNPLCLERGVSERTTLISVQHTTLRSKQLASTTT